MNRHVKNNHEISLHKYYETYFKDSRDELKDEGIKQEETDEGFLIWVSKCEFKCKECGKYLSCRETLIRHAKTMHSLPLKR